jgi:hypothetical protein
VSALRGRGGPLLPVLIAVVPVLAAVAVKIVLNEATGADVGFIPWMAAIVVAAWLGGFLPGVGATAVAILV